MMAEPDKKSLSAATAITGGAATAPASGDSKINLAAILEPGTVLGGRYEILEMLGIGGMGAVYKAKDRELDRLIALKVIRPDLARNPEILQRFKQELLLARQITHKNVIRIFDLGEADGIRFITMEYIVGKDLKAYLAERGKLPPEEATTIMQQVVAGLAAAHSEDVIHRDLKPGNIMRDEQGRVVLMDFGLARAVTGDGMTQTGAMLGTVEYMSPEQAKAEKLDARSDLFTVGLIFYELLTGKSPYPADSALASLLKRTQEPAIPAVQADPTIPAALSKIVAKCLERDPKQRYQSADELLQDLGTGTAPASSKSVQISLPRVGVAVNRKILGVAGAVVVVLAVLLAIPMVRHRIFGGAAVRTMPQKPVTVLVADFTNHTGDPVFDDTLEPMVNVALEGAKFINAYSRGTARKLAEKLPHATDKLDEQPARLVALSQGISAVITGEISRRGDSYTVDAIALDAASGNVLAKSEITAANKDQILGDIPKLVAPIRQALGDTTPESEQLERTRGAFTAANLEVVHQYGIAMEEQFAGKVQQALQSFAKAAALDPNFARAYSGMTSAALKLDQQQEADKYIKQAMEHVDRMTDRERYRVRGFYYMTSGNWKKCSEEYTQLISNYPGDNIAHNNLGVCLSQMRNLPKAAEEARLDLQTNPNATAAANLSLFSSYSGDFPAGQQEALQIEQKYPSFEYGYLAQAFAELGQGQLSQAGDAYQKLKTISPLGGSMSASGLADLALYQGRFAEAVRMFEEGAAADLEAKRPDAAADKLAALAFTQLSMGRTRPAIEAAGKALANSPTMKIRFLAGQIFAEAGETSKAQKLGSDLANEIQSEPQSYAKIIEGEIALKRRDSHQAIKSLTDATTLLDTWIGHFELGRAYLQAGAFAEASSEFDTCIKRRGEALSLFLDQVPTFGYLPPAYYYQGRVREGLHSPGFADSYRTYLSLRGQAGEDPLLQEIRRRLGQ
jgi:tetratricopeptide (TPR) repeat protein